MKARISIKIKFWIVKVLIFEKLSIPGKIFVFFESKKERKCIILRYYIKEIHFIAYKRKQGIATLEWLGVILHNLLFQKLCIAV